jgi:hypothetical protein
MLKTKKVERKVSSAATCRLITSHAPLCLASAKHGTA